MRILDFDRVDVLAAGNDHVLDAVDDEDEAVFVHVTAVAGVHPAIDHGAGGLLRPLPITHHDIVAAHDDLTDGAEGNRLVVGIDDAHLAAERYAGRRTRWRPLARPSPMCSFQCSRVAIGDNSVMP